MIKKQEQEQLGIMNGTKPCDAQDIVNQIQQSSINTVNQIYSLILTGAIMLISPPKFLLVVILLFLTVIKIFENRQKVSV
ncbi:unnamed protein product (macronuclear) [Paramecium tetraurelia]|uniref:Uncharacterized protein n=1 Tax=Paramecium tetraurelia TaxID=5888 RepID=A0CZ62_PARTE|nr:uncharacterized protein GSPATT00039119001 [Paramecium tetraurelia]CAK76079.1 unnamed protein product [Paramecium tetraurelia]|eukprot:XP_001443476.1 hypothetical protein (macronuclear) [Paramecium tetraurelia strain d4-2]